MNTTDELEENSDTSDEDYVPDEKKSEILSEVDSDGDPEDSLSEGEDKVQKIGKRKRNSGKSKKRQKKSEETINISNENAEEMNEEEKKKKEDDLWADFMKDTGFQSKKNVNCNVSTSKVNTTPVSKSSSENKPKLTNNKPVEEKVKITKIFEFAGEEVAVEKEVSVNSAEARLLNKSTSQTTQNKSKSKGGLSGIGGILNQLGKKPKISTLEKSKLDWDRFKKEENLEEELQNHNKGRDGYLEKQDFLQRADLRRFEIEKEVRTVERNRRMNSL